MNDSVPGQILVSSHLPQATPKSSHFGDRLQSGLSVFTLKFSIFLLSILIFVISN